MADVVTFDFINLRIVEITTGGDNELDVSEIYSEWKQALLDDPANLGFPAAFRYVGADPISETQNLGSTYFLINGWRIRPAEHSHKLTLVGNIYTDPAGDDEFVPTLGAFNVSTKTRVSNLVDSVLVNSPDIQYSSFNEKVSIDLTSPYSGTDYPTGTPRQKVNNFADALTIANTRGLGTLHLHSDCTLDSGLNFQGKTIEAHSINTIVTVSSAAQVNGCIFQNMNLQGTLDGNITINNCVLGDLVYVDGTILNSALTGTIELSGSQDVQFINCWDGLPGLGTPTIDMGTGSDLNVRNYKGALAITNKTGPEEISIDIVGRVILDSTVTNGSMVIRGIGTIEGTASGSFTIVSTLLSEPSIAAEVDSVLSGTHGAGGWDSAGSTDWSSTERNQIRGALGIVGTQATPAGGGHLQDVRTPVVANLDTTVSSRAAPGAAMTLTSGERSAVADATWDEAISGHLGAGSTGASLNTASTDATAAKTAAQSADSKASTIISDVAGLNDLSTTDITTILDARGLILARVSLLDELDVSAPGSVAEDAMLARKVAFNRLEVTGFGAPGTCKMRLYDDDGTTPLIDWYLNTSGGEPVVTNVGIQTKRGVPTTP